MSSYYIPEELIREITSISTIGDVLKLRLISKEWDKVISDDRFWCTLLQLQYNVEQIDKCKQSYKNIYNTILFWNIIESVDSRKRLGILYLDLKKLETMYKIYLAYENFFLDLTKDLNLEEDDLIKYHKLEISQGLENYIEEISDISKQLKTKKGIIKVEEGIQDELAIFMDDVDTELFYFPFPETIMLYKFPLKTKKEGLTFLKDLWKHISKTNYGNKDINLYDVNDKLGEEKNIEWLKSKGPGVVSALKKINNNFIFGLLRPKLKLKDYKVKDDDIKNYIGNYDVDVLKIL